MIDEKKIKAAKEEIYEDRFLLNGEEVAFDNDAKEEMFYKEDIKEAIGLGAKWAINELLKDLWHPAKEIPEEERPVLVVYKHGGYSIEYWKAYNISGQVNYWTLDITQWLYVDELFPKEGCNHD